MGSGAMETKTLVEVLRRHPFIEGFEDEYVEKMAAMAEETQFGRDEVIFREGGECPYFYLLLSGKVALEASAPGRILRIQTLAGGDELGWSAVLGPRGKQFQARSIEPGKALLFKGAEVRAACDADFKFGYALMTRLLNIVAVRLQATRMQLLDVYAPRGAKLV
jgi:CRP-like cAMP-binding protein